MLEKIQVTRDSGGELAAVTWDSPGRLGTRANRLT